MTFRDALNRRKIRSQLLILSGAVPLLMGGVFFGFAYWSHRQEDALRHLFQSKPVVEPSPGGSPTRRNPRATVPDYVETPAQALAQNPIEYQIKAAILGRLAQFVSWPPQAFAGAQAPIVVGVLGETPFENLEQFLDEKIDGRSLMVRYYRRVEEAADCQVLFISASEAPRFESIMDQLKGRPILTVGDVDLFTRAGGMVRMDMEAGKLRLRVNFDEATANGVTISRKIQRSATTVTKEKG